MYTQCELHEVRMYVSGVTLPYHKHVGWIPTKFAKIGKLVEIDGIDYLLKVANVYSTKTEEWVLAHERDWKKQREMSDV